MVLQPEDVLRSLGEAITIAPNPEIGSEVQCIRLPKSIVSYLPLFIFTIQIKDGEALATEPTFSDHKIEDQEEPNWYAFHPLTDSPEAQNCIWVAHYELNKKIFYIYKVSCAPPFEDLNIAYMATCNGDIPEGKHLETFCQALTSREIDLA